MKAQTFNIELRYQSHNLALKKPRDIEDVANDIVEFIERKCNSDVILEATHTTDVTSTLYVTNIEDPDVDLMLTLDFDTYVSEQDLIDFFETEMLYVPYHNRELTWEEVFEDDYETTDEDYITVGLLYRFITMVEPVDE